MNFMSRLQLKNHGAALIIVIFFFIGISAAIIHSATIGAITELRTYRTLAVSKYAYVAAEAGLEDIYYRVVQSKQVPGAETLVLNGATSTVAMNDVSATEKQIYAVGTAGERVRKIYLDISYNKEVRLLYGAQVGEGGLTMKNGASIDGIAPAKGDVYSDGQIIGAPGVTISGNAISSKGITEDLVARSLTCTTDEDLGKQSPALDYAESFVMSATSSALLTKVSLYLKRKNVPTGANVVITADAGGKPATTALATTPLDNALVSTSYQWVDILFPDPATLEPATTYWIVVDTSPDASKYWTWCRSDSDTYATGTPLYKADWTAAGAWSAVAAGDMTFQLTFGHGVSLVKDITIAGTVKGDTLEGLTVGGDAYYQTISDSTVTGTSYPASPTPPYVPLPISTTTLAAWRGDAIAGGTINGSCGAGGLPECNTLPLTLGPKKINGNLIVDGGNDPTKILTVNGTLYVTGNVVIKNQGRIKCALAYLENSCVIITDGYVNVNNNATLAGSGVPGSFLMLVSTKKGCLGESSPSCSVNGSAIAIENNVDGALFYTTDSLIDISNGAIVTAVVGYMMQLQNNTKIIYDASIAKLSYVPAGIYTTGQWSPGRWNEY
jgi:hypothetical protein